MRVSKQGDSNYSEFTVILLTLHCFFFQFPTRIRSSPTRISTWAPSAIASVSTPCHKGGGRQSFPSFFLSFFLPSFLSFHFCFFLFCLFFFLSFPFSHFFDSFFFLSHFPLPFFFVGPCCSQGATLLLTMRCRPSGCLSLAGPSCVELTTSLSSFFLLLLVSFFCPFSPHFLPISLCLFPFFLLSFIPSKLFFFFFLLSLSPAFLFLFLSQLLFHFPVYLFLFIL